MRANRIVSVAVGVGAMVAWAGPAWAPFHLAVIEQAFFGTEDCPQAQYVVVRTQAAGQTFVANQQIATQVADGTDAGAFGTFQQNLPNAGQGVAILMATAEAETLFGIEADQVASGSLVFPDGRVCFGEFGGPVDCVAYGDFTGDNPGHGDPAVAPELGMALVRVSEVDDNSIDFERGAPAPENNAGDVGVLGTQCGVEMPTPTPTSAPTQPPTSGCVGDCDGNGEVVINELILGVNIALGSTGLGMCPAFDRNEDTEVTVDELVSGVNNASNGCPDLPTSTPTSDATATPTPRPTFDGPLGTRRFSFNPEESGLRIAGLPIAVEGTGFEGFIEFEAGEPDPETGVAPVDIVDASPFFEISVSIPIGPSITLCIEPDRSALPLENAGILSCFGGMDLGFGITQDHNIGVVGENGFTEQDCLDMGGMVEPPGGAHPGVCNSGFMIEPAFEDSGPGALLIAPDPETLEGGFPVVLTMENALPCGDEGAAGLPFPLTLTTGTSLTTILDRNNIPGSVLERLEQGVNFDCTRWTEEDGPGTLVFVAPVLDLNTGVVGFFDLANVFEFVD